ncbi:MAG: hypothetical protein Q9167_000266 [Letrouitia subvulpina]
MSVSATRAAAVAALPLHVQGFADLSPNLDFLQETRCTRLQSGISLKSEKAKEIEANKTMASAVPAAKKPTKKKPNNAKSTAKASTSVPSFPNLPGGSVAPTATLNNTQAPTPTSNAVLPNSKVKRTTPGVRSTKRKESPENEDDEATETQKKAKGPHSSRATKTIKDPPSRKGKSAKDSNEDKKTKTPSRKRKSTEDDGEDVSENDAHPPKKARIPKARAPTKVKPHRLAKPKVVINQAPTEVLDVYVFGEGSSGELGLGTAKIAIDVKRPRLNMLLSAQNVGVTQIACGGMHVAAVTKDNKVLTWGVNDQGALGRDTTWDGGLRDIDDTESNASDSSNNGLNPKECTPTPLPDKSFPEGTVIVKVSAGDSHTLALTDDGHVYGWGTYRNSEGILGFSKNSYVQETPVLLPNLTNIVDIASGANHALALNTKGVVYTWGCGQQAQLGFRMLSRKQVENLEPNPLRLRGKNVRLIACGADHSFAIDGKEQVWSWGVNTFGATGFAKGAGGDNAYVVAPQVIPSLQLQNDKVTHIAGGRQHTLAVTESGKCLVWGRFDGSQTGVDASAIPEDNMIRDGKGNPRILTEPTVVPGVGSTRAVAAGPDHSIAITDGGKAFSWGFSANYQTGQGTDDDVDEPTVIANTAVRDRYLNWAGAGGQYSVLTSPAAVQSVAENPVVADNGEGSSRYMMSGAIGPETASTRAKSPVHESTADAQLSRELKQETSSTGSA